MTGSIVLMADLIRQLSMPLQVGVVQASSYKTGTERGELRLNEDFLPDISHRNVLLVDDIFDTGHTLAAMAELLRRQQPASLRTAVLLAKQGRQAVNFVPDHVVFEIPDMFVVGYGLDYRDRFRELPHVAVLEPDDLTDGATS